MSTVVSVNPMMVRAGDKLVLQTRSEIDPETFEEVEKVTKSRTVRRVSACGKAECVHLDHECYDVRFSRVRIVR